MRVRQRRVHPLSIFYFVIILGLLVGASIMLDRGPATKGVVSGKLEEMQVSYAPQASWYRWYRVGVTFPTRDGGMSQATIGMPAARFDALREGDTVAIRYLAAFPLIARAADRTTWSVVRELGARAAGDHVLAPLVLWLVGGALALWVASHVATPVIFVVGAAWIVAAFPMLFPAPSHAPLPAGDGRARVVALSLIDRAPERTSSRRRGRFLSDLRRLDAPYHVVRLRVPVAGRPDSVLAIDAVDTGSVAGLAPNAIVPVRYDARAPRGAMLRDGTRTFGARNRYHLRVPIIGFGILGTLAAWTIREARQRKRRRAVV